MNFIQVMDNQLGIIFNSFIMENGNLNFINDHIQDFIKYFTFSLYFIKDLKKEF